MQGLNLLRPKSLRWMGEQSGIFDHTALVMVQLRQKKLYSSPIERSKKPERGKEKKAEGKVRRRNIIPSKPEPMS